MPLTRNFKTKQQQLKAIYAKQRSCGPLKALQNGVGFQQPQGFLAPHIVVVGHVAPISMPYITRAMQEVGIKPERVYWTDLLKFPPTRHPYPNEIERALSFLEDEIKVLQPRVVVPLDQLGVEIFFEQENITATHGHAYDWEDYWLIPVRHPRACLLGKEWEEELVTDLEVVAEYAKRKKK